MQQLPFPVDPAGPAPGAKHPSIDAARDASGPDGTRSILDMDRVASEPRAGSTEDLMRDAMSNAQNGVVDLSAYQEAFMGELGAVRPVSPSELQRLYGTDKPTRAA
ncbi:MAG TPA: hypothetical protein VLT45_05270, partial [Kofleriaceae bacterium]|nr:hypothetical protein [Kofleriaceae bacterium]